MNVSSSPASPRARQSAFTMVEIALCIGIIGFALVAIIGVLPTGLRVQKDNRDDTVLGQDATIFMEAIRGGAQGTNLHLIGQFAERVFAAGVYHSNLPPVPSAVWGSNVIGVLCNPNANGRHVDMRSMSGIVADQGTNQLTSFRYRLFCQVTNSTVLSGPVAYSLYEIRLTFRWPILPNNLLGEGRRTYRTLVVGDVFQDASATLPGTLPARFFVSPLARTNSL